MASAVAPTYRTAALWLVLTFFLFVGTVAAAFVVYGVTGILASGALAPDLAITIAGAVVASMAMLFLTGILYRIDRRRGVPHREVRLFE